MRRSLLGSLLALCVSTALAGCGGTQPVAGVPGLAPEAGRTTRHATQQPIQHLIVIVQQYRTFDDLFSG